MSWLLLLDPPAPAAWNMALDEALLGAAETEGLRCLRLYAWDPPALSFGRNEPARRRYDRAAIAARGLATVRRPTGGRAVWHHREVTYCVTAPASTFGTLRQTYVEIHAMLAQALNAIGARVTLAPPPPPDRPAAGVGAGACFASVAGGEVMAQGGAKVVGSAQVRRGGAFLQHGSILLEAGQDLVAGLTLDTADPPAATGLGERLGPGATFEVVAGAVARTAAGRWGAPLPAAPGGVPAGVRARAALLRARYEDPAWTWRR